VVNKFNLHSKPRLQSLTYVILIRDDYEMMAKNLTKNSKDRMTLIDLKEMKTYPISRKTSNYWHFFFANKRRE
jgi:hypothetical protein